MRKDSASPVRGRARRVVNREARNLLVDREPKGPAFDPAENSTPRRSEPSMSENEASGSTNSRHSGPGCERLRCRDVAEACGEDHDLMRAAVAARPEDDRLELRQVDRRHRRGGREEHRAGPRERCARGERAGHFQRAARLVGAAGLTIAIAAVDAPPIMLSVEVCQPLPNSALTSAASNSLTSPVVVGATRRPLPRRPSSARVERRASRPRRCRAWR